MASLSMLCTRDAGTPRAARRWITEQFGRFLDDATVDALHLIATELIANAIDHSTGRIELCVAVQDRRSRIEVFDEGRDCDGVNVAIRDRDVRGRGLRLVDALSMDWGCDRTIDGKVIWAELGDGVRPSVPS